MGDQRPLLHFILPLPTSWKGRKLIKQIMINYESILPLPTSWRVKRIIKQNMTNFILNLSSHFPGEKNVSLKCRWFDKYLFAIRVSKMAKIDNDSWQLIISTFPKIDTFSSHRMVLITCAWAPVTSTLEVHGLLSANLTIPIRIQGGA